MRKKLALLVALLLLPSWGAKADLLFQFNGTVTSVTFASTPNQPFSIGQSVTASIFVPYITENTGKWEITRIGIYFYETDTLAPDVSVFRYIQFGDVVGEKTIRMTDDAQIRATGIGANLISTDFCCYFSFDVPFTGENGQALLGPSGGTGTYSFPPPTSRPTANISGSWTVQRVPEPATWALLSVALIGMVGLRVFRPGADRTLSRSS